MESTIVQKGSLCQAQHRAKTHESIPQRLRELGAPLISPELIISGPRASEWLELWNSYRAATRLPRQLSLAGT